MKRLFTLTTSFRTIFLRQAELERPATDDEHRRMSSSTGVASAVLACCLFCTMTTMSLFGQTLTTLATFDGTDGESEPLYVSLVQGFDGNLYGTTSGNTLRGTNLPGAVFRITPNGTLTTLHTFCSQAGCADGKAPYAGLALGTDGNLYGTTTEGGANNDGTIFKMTPEGTLTTLYSFCGLTGCPEFPAAPLIQASDGNFYGTTVSGGNNGANCHRSPGCGTVFKMTPGGIVGTLYTFCSQTNCPDGGGPYGGLVQGTDDNLYGTTSYGGSFPDSYGTVFKISRAGTLTTYKLTAPRLPYAGLVQGTDGKFYGTSYQGGGSCGLLGGCGAVFRITSDGVQKVLHHFCSQSQCADGEFPRGPLIQAIDGNFYGTTQLGGTVGSGTVFQIMPGGMETVLYSFCSQTGCTDGGGPFGGLVQHTNGTFYGTTSCSGTLSVIACGTVYSLSMGFGPFVKTVPTIGKLGVTVNILGTDLTGATNVSFNGNSAVFKVISATHIKAVVPTGATTGEVTVVTPSGTLTSNIPFRVIP